MSRTKNDPPALDRRETLGLLALSLGVALIVIDMSIVNLILPQMARDLELGFSGLQYVIALFSLAAAAVTIAAGDVADRIGHRNALPRRAGGVRGRQRGRRAGAERRRDAARARGPGRRRRRRDDRRARHDQRHVRRPRAAMAFGLYGMTFAVSGAIGPLLGAVAAESVELALGVLGQPRARAGRVRRRRQARAGGRPRRRRAPRRRARHRPRQRRASPRSRSRSSRAPRSR